jgi:hypothetical protein
MRTKAIADTLKRVLLEDAPFSQALFEYELQEHVEGYLESKHTDNDHYFFAITVQTDDAAMLLINEDDTIYVNEEARTVLRGLWRDNYTHNMRLLIPEMAKDLHDGYLFATGVSVVA